MVNYDRFDALAAAVDDSDDEAEGLRNKPASRLEPGSAAHSTVMKGQETMFKIVGWLGEAAPWLSDNETTRLVRFVAASDKTFEPDLVKRYEALAQFMRTEGDPIKPDKRALIAVCHHAEKQRQGTDSVDDAAAHGRVLVVAMGALNALTAFDDEGGADRVLEQLRKEPAGELATMLEEFEYAKYSIQYESSDVDGAGADGAEKAKEAAAKAKARAEANAKAKKAKAKAGSEEDDTPLPPLPQEAHPATIPQPRSMFKHVVRSVSLHVGSVLVAIVLREAALQFYPEQVQALKDWWVGGSPIMQ